MASQRRIEKINVFLKEEIAKIVDREVEFPEGIMVTITRAAASQDMRYATIFFSMLGGGNSEESSAVALLLRNVYHIQQALNRVARIRPVPQIRFVHDEEEERREGIERSLAKLKREGEL